MRNSNDAGRKIGEDSATHMHEQKQTYCKPS